jgi:hypothetical protein
MFEVYLFPGIRGYTGINKDYRLSMFQVFLVHAWVDDKPVSVGSHFSFEVDVGFLYQAEVIAVAF